MQTNQRSNIFLGVIIGVVVGLAAALAVAVYVTQVPVPFTNKSPTRTAEQDAAEAAKNQGWDPNAPLYGKQKPAAIGSTAVPEVVAPSAPPGATAGAVPPLSKAASDVVKAANKAAADNKAAEVAAKPTTAAKPSADPLGDLVKSKTTPAPATTVATATPAATGNAAEPFIYFVQVGAFRTTEDAEAQRAKLSLMGMDPRVTEREQAGRTVYRVRLGPFNTKDAADQMTQKLTSSGMESALVRVQR